MPATKKRSTVCISVVDPPLNNASRPKTSAVLCESIYVFCFLDIVTRVYRAKGLVAADMGGTSDPYCVLELDNTRVTKRTQI